MFWPIRTIFYRRIASATEAAAAAHFCSAPVAPRNRKKKSGELQQRRRRRKKKRARAGTRGGSGDGSGRSEVDALQPGLRQRHRRRRPQPPEGDSLDHPPTPGIPAPPFSLADPPLKRPLDRGVGRRGILRRRPGSRGWRTQNSCCYFFRNQLLISARVVLTAELFIGPWGTLGTLACFHADQSLVSSSIAIWVLCWRVEWPSGVWSVGVMGCTPIPIPSPKSPPWEESNCSLCANSLCEFHGFTKTSYV